MPLFGAHMSVAGGLHNAVTSARSHGCSSLQIFTKNSNQWQAKPLETKGIEAFRHSLLGSGIQVLLAHDSYLINLASPDDALRQKSIEAFQDELQRADALGLDYLVTHPGARLDSKEEDALVRVAAALDEVHARLPKCRVKTLLETTAGQGTTLGYRFEHLARILELVEKPKRLGVCFDTCHVFAAGYALAPQSEYQATFQAFDQIVGLKWLKAFHLNDSKKPLGSRVDRHDHIGKGELGIEPFRLLVNDPRFHQLPMVLETPKEEGDQDDMDTINLKVVNDLIETANP